MGKLSTIWEYRYALIAVNFDTTDVDIIEVFDDETEALDNLWGLW